MFWFHFYLQLNVSEYSDGELLLTEWIPYVHAARHSSEQNVEVSVDHRNGQRSLFYTIIRQVAPNNELLVWYSDQLAEELGLPRITDSSKRGRHIYRAIQVINNLQIYARSKIIMIH